VEYRVKKNYAFRKKLEEENLSSETLKRDAQEMHSSKTSAQEKTLKKERVPAQVETGKIFIISHIWIIKELSSHIATRVKISGE